MLQRQAENKFMVLVTTVEAVHLWLDHNHSDDFETIFTI